jgi:SAM-dependent methyltransferase
MFEVDCDFYRKTYRDAHRLSDDEVRRHYATIGKSQARMPAAQAVREHFGSLLHHRRKILEIGPFLAPICKGAGVKYFDILDKEGLEKRGKEIGFPGTEAPHIDFVDPSGNMSAIDERFDAVVSSHCVEHQPDLIAHFAQVARMLEPGGRYFLLIPDHRYCFDHFLRPSTAVEVMRAHREKRTRHTLQSKIQHVALTTHNDAARHWAGDHADPLYPYSTRDRVGAAIWQHEQAGDDYADMHAWQFTPDSLESLLNELAIGNRVALRPVCIYPTPRGRSEFVAVLGIA